MVLLQNDGLVFFVVLVGFVGAGEVVIHGLVLETVRIGDGIDDTGDGIADRDIGLVVAAHVARDREQKDAAVEFTGNGSLTEAGTVFGKPPMPPTWIRFVRRWASGRPTSIMRFRSSKRCTVTAAR